MNIQTRHRAIDLLRKMVGTDRFTDKCESVGYTWRVDGAEAHLLDGGEIVGVGSGNEFVLCENLSSRTTQREVCDAEWDAFVLLDRWRVAVHESGHAIIALQFNLELEHVFLAEDTNAGETCLRGYAKTMGVEHPRRNPEAMKRFFVAGAAAELVLFDRYNRHGVEDDQARFVALTGSNETDAFDDFARSVAGELLTSQINALATQLHKKGFLSVYRVEALFKEQGPQAHLGVDLS